MSDLGDALRVALADTFAFYLKIHGYHWNVTGEDFYEFHKFFNKLYDEVWEAVDAIAEHIRAIDEYAPGSLSRFSELTNIEDAVTIPLKTGNVSTAVQMASQLLHDNEIVIQSLTRAYHEAEAEKELGVSNFLQDRIDIHHKHGWQLRSTVKNR